MNLQLLKPHFEVDDTVVGWRQKLPYDLDKAPARYAGWLHYARQHELLPPEYLLPRLYCPCPNTLPAFMHRADEIAPTDELRQLRDDLHPWGFWYKLAPGIATKKLGIAARNRMTCRSHLISGTVEKLLGHRIGSTTLLDMGCHNGFFCLDMASRGVQHMTGVELRPENIQQGEFLKKHYGIENIRYEQGNIAHWNPAGRFRVVLNLGLLYHVIDPVTLVRNTYDWCEDFAVIDTVCHYEPISAFIAAFNKDLSKRGEGTHTVELHPTYRALIDTMHDAGFVDLLELIAVPAKEGERVANIYQHHVRRCIVGFKRPMADVLRDNGLA